MKKFLPFILLLFLLNSCHIFDESLSITIHNRSDHEIQSFTLYSFSGDYIYWDSTVVTVVIPVNDSVNYEWKNPYLSTMDGAYQVKINDRYKDFGYFSNGHIISGGIYDIYTLWVYNDSITFK